MSMMAESFMANDVHREGNFSWTTTLSVAASMLSFQSTHRHISAPPRPQLQLMNDWVTAAGLDIAKLGKVRQEKLWHALTSSLRGRFRVKIR